MDTISSPAIYSKYKRIKWQCCQEWKDSFKRFKEDIGEFPRGYYLEKISRSEPYSKDNFQWILIPVKRITYEGKEYTFSELAELFNINVSTLKHRFKKNWSLEDIKNIPTHPPEDYIPWMNFPHWYKYEIRFNKKVFVKKEDLVKYANEILEFVRELEGAGEL